VTNKGFKPDSNNSPGIAAPDNPPTVSSPENPNDPAVPGAVPDAGAASQDGSPTSPSDSPNNAASPDGTPVPPDGGASPGLPNSGAVPGTGVGPTSIDPNGRGNNQPKNSPNGDGPPGNSQYTEPGWSNKIVGPAIGATIGIVAAAGMLALLVARQRQRSMDVRQQRAAPLEDIPESLQTSFSPHSFMIAVQNAIDNLTPAPENSANVTGESKFVEQF